MDIKNSSNTLTPQQKRKQRFDKWLSPPEVQFSSHEAQKKYQERVTRFINAIELRESDRVPVFLPSGYFPIFYSGRTLKTAMYDYEELKLAYSQFLSELDMDGFTGAGLVSPAKVLEIIDYRLHKWPGHGIPDDAPMYQFVEGQYMLADEYDRFMNNPSDFLIRTFLPRIAGGLTGLSKLAPATPFIFNPVKFISRFSDPDVRSAVQVLLDAGKECENWSKALREISKIALQAGIPPLYGAMCGAPFDLIGDGMRGTRDMAMDMFRRPEKVIETAEKITPIVIDEAVAAADNALSPLVFMPLHKGAQDYMSTDQFEKFYWPTLKQVMLGLINEGLVPIPFAEGNYSPRLEIIQDMPRSSTIWWFETIDMQQAKRVVGANNCIAGNLPVSLLTIGSPEDVKKASRKLIETCASGGGYILSGAAGINENRADNLNAIMEAAKEFGGYNKQ